MAAYFVSYHTVFINNPVHASMLGLYIKTVISKKLLHFYTLMFEIARMETRSARIAYVSTIAGKSIALPN